MLDINEKTYSFDRTSMAKICVKMKLGYVFPEGIDIQVGNHSYCEEIYYVNIPFTCSMCNMYGYLKKACLKKDICDKVDGVEMRMEDMEHVHIQLEEDNGKSFNPSLLKNKSIYEKPYLVIVGKLL